MRLALLASVVAGFTCPPLAAQEDNDRRDHVTVVRERAALFQKLATTLEGVQACEDLRGVADEIYSAIQGTEKLQAEMRTLGPFSPEVEKRLTVEFTAMTSLQKRFDVEWDRVLAIEGARDALRGTPLFRMVDGPNRAACKDNLKHVGIALYLYERDHGRFPGPGNPAFLKTDR